MARSMVPLKMRGTNLDTSIQRFRIGRGGVALDGAFSGYTGILSGNARRLSEKFDESERRIAAAEMDARAKRRQAFYKKMRDG
jgi:hypothetical protein